MCLSVLKMTQLNVNGRTRTAKYCCTRNVRIRLISPDLLTILSFKNYRLVRMCFFPVGHVE